MFHQERNSFEWEAKDLFGSFGKTAGTLVGSLGEQTEKFTRPKELEQTVDPLLAKRLKEQGLTDQQIREKTTVQKEDLFKTEDITLGDTAFTALELYPGGGFLSQALNYLKNRKSIGKISIRWNSWNI